MGYIDIHSHILPGVDDGAKSIEEAIELLIQEKENGVTSVLCTPHFYPEIDAYEAHTEKCEAAFSFLCEAIRSKELPSIYLGHEVQYFAGISRCQTLDKLCIKGTNILLLELPFLTPLTDYMLTEVENIDRDLGITVILAHIERYIGDRRFKKIIKLINNGSIKAQINADAVINPLTKKSVQKLIKRNLISYIASDAHSPELRPVLIQKALLELKAKYYAQMVAINKESEKLESIIKGV